MKLSVFLLSHNKNGYVQEAIQSILDQDYKNFDLWIIENSTDDVTRKALEEYLRGLHGECRVIYETYDVPLDIRMEKYVPSWLLNKYYPHAGQDDIILYLSDDDLFVPGLFSAVAEAFTEHPEWAALYFHMARTRAWKAGTGTDWALRWAEILAEVPRGSGAVDCQVDGGQVAYRKSVLGSIDQPYFDEAMDQASHCDGTHLQKVAERYLIHPLPVNGVVHRHTPLSTWTQ